MLERLVTLDFEASGLGRGTYPIEVAVCRVLTGEVLYEGLIAPLDGWLARGDWQAESEPVHGMTREHVVAHGRPAGEVCDRLTAAIGDAVVLSDSVLTDGYWLGRLYEDIGREPPFLLASITDTLGAITGLEGQALTTEYRRLETGAMARFPILHRAAADARCLAEILRQAEVDRLVGLVRRAAGQHLTARGAS